MPVHEMTAALAVVNELALAAIESDGEEPLAGLTDVVASLIEPIVRRTAPEHPR